MWDAIAAEPQVPIVPGNTRVKVDGKSALVDMTDLNGERRRSAGSGAAKYSRCDSIRNQLPVDIGNSKLEAGIGGKVRRDKRGDGAKILTKRAGRLAQRGPCIRRSIVHGTHYAGMRAVRTAADRQELLRRGECCHCRRWQQCFKNAQQQKCRNSPHVVSVHGVPAAAKQLS